MVSAAGDGGGGGSSYFSADPAAISAAGRSLTAQAGTVGSARRYTAIAGLQEAQVVEQAAAAFRDAWDPVLDRWQTSLASLGDATDSAGQAISGTDADAASAWNAMNGAMGTGAPASPAAP